MTGDLLAEGRFDRNQRRKGLPPHPNPSPARGEGLLVRVRWNLPLPSRERAGVRGLGNSLQLRGTFVRHRLTLLDHLVGKSTGKLLQMIEAAGEVANAECE